MTLAARIFLTQGAISVLCASLAALFVKGWLFSLVLGLVTMLFAYVGVLMVMWALERFRQPAKTIVRWYYTSQGLKYLVLILLVILYIHSVSVIWLPFLLGIAMVQVGAVVAGLRGGFNRMVAQ